MIQHTVAFQLEPNLNEDDIRAFFRAARALSEIAGVKEFEVLKQVGKKNSFAYALSMYFESQHEYDAYNSHPQHVAFVENFWLKHVSDFIELDYVRSADV